VTDQVNPYSRPSDLRITDMRFTDILGAPMHCTLMKLYTNQGLVGLGEVRDGASKTYALALKGRLLGENPCDVDRLFRRIKQFGGHGRQGGGVSAVEVALWDLAGKAFGVPVYQLLGGKFRDSIRMYCDTDAREKGSGASMGRALAERLEMGFSFLKMDLGIGLLYDVPDALSAPLGLLEEFRRAGQALRDADPENDLEFRARRSRWYALNNVAHPHTGIHLTEQGLDALEQYMSEVRTVIGYEAPLAVDHIGHIGVEDCIRLARRLEAYSPAWLEDPVPWQLTEHYARINNATTVPVCTGEDIYLKEGFRPLLNAGAVSVVHPDVLTAGGILETKKIGDEAQDRGVAMAIHMAESPVGCLAAVHAAAATENFLALEYHSADVPWWNDIVTGLPKPIVQGGRITVPAGPGLGIEDLDDDVLREHVHPDDPGVWEPTDHWNHEWAHDRLWS
jgi:gluconate/galactonate dehydratase